MRVLRRVLIWLVLLAPGWAAATEVILYAYHLKPPYIVDREKGVGLYYDLARYLNEHVPGYTFRTVYLPRRRLEHDLELGRLNGLVVGVNPNWFKDEARTRYMWTPPILHDDDIVVSLKTRPVKYEGPESLVGKHVGLAMGYYYFGVDELVRANRVRRDDAISEEASLEKLLRERVDAAIVTRRTLDFLLRRHPDWQGRFYVAHTPHDSFDRMVLVPKEFGYLMPDLNAALGPILHDPEWQGMVQHNK